MRAEDRHFLMQRRFLPFLRGLPQGKRRMDASSGRWEKRYLSDCSAPRGCSDFIRTRRLRVNRP